MFFRSERPKLLEIKSSLAAHMVAHGSRDADTTRRAFRLKPRCNIHRVPVQVSSVGDRIANVDPDAEPDGTIRRLTAIVDRVPAAAPSRHSAPPRRCYRTR